MTAGLRVCTVTGATVSVMVAGNSGGRGCASDTPIACTSSAGTVPPGSSETSSHTAADCAGPSFVVDAGFPDHTCPVRQPLARQVQQRPVCGAHVDRCQRHLLVEHIGQLQFVGQVHLAVGGGHRDRCRDGTGNQWRDHRWAGVRSVRQRGGSG